jgi:hypothetical protein
MAKLIVNRGQPNQQIFTLRPGAQRLGRATGNDIQVVDASISGSHCEISLENNRIVIRDLGSTNGTFINGQRIKDGAMGPGEILTLGQINALFEGDMASIPSISIPSIAIPNLQSGSAPLRGAATLGTSTATVAMGTSACANHPSVGARFRCIKCRSFFCETCIRVLGRVGGKKMLFCPNCNSQCETVAAPARKKGGRFLARLTQTIKLLTARK